MVFHSLLCCLVLSLRKVAFNYGTAFPVLSDDGMWSSGLCGPLPVAMAIESPPSRGWTCSIAVSFLGNGYSSTDSSSYWGAELPLSTSSVTETYWPYLMPLWIIGWGCLFSYWNGLMAYWSTSLLSWKNRFLVCCVPSAWQGRFPLTCSHMRAQVPHQTFLDISIKSFIYSSFSCLLSYISVHQSQY